MARQRGLDGDACRLQVADLADHDDVGVLAQDRAQGVRESRSRWPAWTWTWLMPLELVFDGVLDREELAVGPVEHLERRVERGGLAAAGGTGDENDAVGLGS